MGEWLSTPACPDTFPERQLLAKASKGAAHSPALEGVGLPRAWPSDKAASGWLMVSVF